MMRREPLFAGTSDIDQLSRIFTALGTPDDAVWPGVESLPNYVPFQPTVGKSLAATFSAASADALALLASLLTYCPTRRATAEAALASDYFTEPPLAAPPSDLVPAVSLKEDEPERQKRIKLE
eukprot:5222064-Pleurochrysis_carterae.AAC.2